MLVALSVSGVLGGPRSEPGPASVSAYSAPDAVGVEFTAHPAALFPDSRMLSGELDLLAAEGPEAKPIFTPLPTAPAPPQVLTPSPVEVAAARIQEHGGSLTEAEVREVLTEAGWPAELHDEALAVAWCESRWSPYAVGDGGNSLGLFQLNVATWFRYAGENPALWADPLVNARTALATYYYDLGRGYEPWKQWSCKP